MARAISEFAAIVIVAGLLPVDGGRIRLDGRDVTHLFPEKRGVGIVYQDSALFPHLTVKDNVGPIAPEAPHIL